MLDAQSLLMVKLCAHFLMWEKKKKQNKNESRQKKLKTKQNKSKLIELIC